MFSGRSACWSSSLTLASRHIHEMDLAALWTGRVDQELRAIR